jgi:hypothetical protein
VVVVIGLLLVGSVAADDLVATVNTEASRVLFTPLQADLGVHLKVSGPGGFLYQRSFAPGVRPYFSIFEKSGLPLDEGLYTYELKPRLEISDEIRKALRAARNGGDDSLIRALQAAGKLPARILIQIGSFSIADGGVVDMSKPESVTKDVVEYDDLIVVGSACVGFDCVDGELFGDDTLRLKENTLRLDFDDTTSTEYFPANDWRIIINDEFAGGAEYFALADVTADTVPFMIKAGAPTGSLFLDDLGRAGLGTSVPDVTLHLVGGDTPTISLDQDSSGGFNPGRWDLSGNENGFSIIDVTNGSLLPFQIQPGTPSSTLSLSATGVGIGTTNPETDLHIYGNDGSTRAYVEDAFTTAATRILFFLKNNGGVRFDMEDTANGVTWVFQNQVGSFEITKAGTGVREVTVDGSGNMVIQGTLTTASSTYPDYVFSSDYELMPLSELREYIRENRHLPNFPVAQEINEDGLNVSATQIKLIEKVEELTLYTLELQQTIEQLQAQVSTLEKALAEQE